MRTYATILLLMSGASLIPGGFGCAGASSPYQTAEPERRDTAKAERLTRRAADLMLADPGKAEELLREALAADLYHGPAHNNLGVLLLDQDRLYEAANEFEWARKLMAGHPGPQINLGIVLERGGRVDEAIQQYEAALDSVPEHLRATQALVRCQIKHDRTDEQTVERLGMIEQRSSADWRTWAADKRLQYMDTTEQ